MPIQIIQDETGIKLAIEDGYDYVIGKYGLDDIRQGSSACSDWVLQLLDKTWLDDKSVLYELAKIIQMEYPENEINWELTFYIVEKKEYLDEDIPKFSKEFTDEDESEGKRYSESFLERVQKGIDESTPEVHETIEAIVLRNLKDYGLPNNIERNLKKFVEARYSSDLKTVKAYQIGAALKHLTDHEKTLVYKYTLDAYEDLNDDLRTGKESEFALYLNAVLSKLPDLKDLVYRGAALSQVQIDLYKQAFEQKTILVELGFTSASKSRQVAEMYSKGNTLFRIISKSGKEVEQLAFFGIKSHQNEQEVIFKSKTKFKALGLKTENGKNFITLEEV